MIVLLFISILAGMLTVLAPCTLTLLPVIVGGTAGGGSSMRRVLVVTAALGISVIMFTFLLKVSTVFFALPQVVWQLISGGVIILLGFAMLFPDFWERIPLIGKINQRSNIAIGAGYQKQSLVGDIAIGAALGPVFSTCSPTYFLILAEVLPRSLSEGVLYLLAYVVGLCGTLVAVAVVGQKMVERIGFASDPHGIFKRSIGVLFVILGFMIVFGYEKKAELFVAEHVYDVTRIELALLHRNETANRQETLSFSSSSAERLAAKSLRYQKAPEISNPSGYINTGGTPITIGAALGKKVVLIDFWTYSCINCIRTLPYLKAWDAAYRDQGLEIIGIHTPEFSFEHVQENVQSAVTRFGIQYPVVIDNEYGTWRAFQNRYWPHVFLIDVDGYIVYDHIGEGDDDRTEAAIKAALRERALVVGMPPIMETQEATINGAVEVDYQAIKSPETYFGSTRNSNLGNGMPGRVGVQQFSMPEGLKRDRLYLGGAWNITSEYAETTEKGSTITFLYDAKDVYFVASALDGARIRITRDGVVLGEVAGVDADTAGVVPISGQRLYHVIHGDAYGEHTLEIELIEGELRAYTFTFG